MAIVAFWGTHPTPLWGNAPDAVMGKHARRRYWGRTRRRSGKKNPQKRRTDRINCMDRNTKYRRHRNSQKRFYRENGIYFITTNTQDRYPFFRDKLICDFFLEELWLSQKLHGFDLPGYAIMPDHVHLLIRPNEKHNYSTIMRFVKRHFSRNVNDMMGKTCPDENAVPQRRQWPSSPLGNASDAIMGNASDTVWGNGAFRDEINSFIPVCEKYHDLFNTADFKKLPRFRWQKSFHFHYIENDLDLLNHMNYILKQPFKHGFDSKYIWVDNVWFG